MEIDFTAEESELMRQLNSPSSSKKISNPEAKIFSRFMIRDNSIPYSTSTIKCKRPQTKEAIAKLHSKIDLIRLKCLKTKESQNLTNQKHVQHYESSNKYSQPEMNESFDLESEEETQHTHARGNTLKMLKSIFPQRPSTIFFEYPKGCGIQPNTEYSKQNRISEIQKFDLTYKITGWNYNCIINTLESNGFVEAQDYDWNIFFDVNATHTKQVEHMNRFQKISHFPGSWSLGLKDFMWRNLYKQRRSHPQEYNFVPMTYLFPTDYDRFQMVREASEKHKLWIMKPTNQACGRGIKMISKETKVKNKKDVLVSQYVANPHLINHLKYDLRVYVVVTSYDPLRIYMFQEGLTRFATFQYTCKKRDIKKRFIHLTNFSVNKHSKNFVKNNKCEKDGEGSKWSLTALKKYYDAHGINSEKLFHDIKDVIIKTCISAEPVMLDIHSKTQQKRNCGFELYGFDILIDSNLKPWLMQVNICPSLSSSSPMDKKIKNTLIADMLNLIGLQNYSKKNFQVHKKKQRQRLLVQEKNKKIFAKNLNNLVDINSSNCIQVLTPEDWCVLFESEEEESRRGNFEKIFPLRDNIDRYKELFEINRYNNNIIWKSIKSDRSFLSCLFNT